MIDNIEKLKRTSPRELQILYKNYFTSNEGQLILEDLKGRFWEYAPLEGPSSEAIVLKAGQQSVLMYIKNQINPPDESIYDRPQETTP